MGSILVVGVPGVGRSTVLDLAAPRLGFPVATFGSVMLRVAKSRGLAEHRDDLRRLSPEQQLEVQRIAAQSVAKLGTCVVDTYLSVLTAEGMLAGMPMAILHALRPARILLLEARPGEILARRSRAEGRRHDEQTEEEIEGDQALNRASAMAVAALTGATVKIVFNHDGRQAAAVESLLAATRGLPEGGLPRLVGGRSDPFLLDDASVQG